MQDPGIEGPSSAAANLPTTAPTDRAVEGFPPTEAGPIRLRNEAVDWRNIDGEVVALDHKDSTYLSINRSGAVLWPALERGSTVEELVAILLEQFEVEPAQARADVETFLVRLSERNLLQG